MKQMISLLILLFAFAKYGEPKPKFMSIHGDINLAILETAPRITEKLGFIYDDQFGGYAFNRDYCVPPRDGRVKFHVDYSCLAYIYNQFEGTPSDSNYVADHYPNFPEDNTGTNFFIGHRGNPGSATKRVSKNDEAFAFADVTTRISRRHSQVYCNDKDYSHYKNLLKPSYNRRAVIVFGKDNKNKYEQTMQCMAVLKKSRNNVIAARLFTLVISDLVYQPFTFTASRLSHEMSVQYAPSSQPSVNAVSYADKSVVETNFVFRTEASGGCQPMVTMQSTDESKASIFFYYNDQLRRMPPIEVEDSSVNCGIAVAQSLTGGEPSFQYMCECN